MRITIGTAMMYARYECHEGHPPKLTPQLIGKAMDALAHVYTGIIGQHVKVRERELVVFDRGGKKGGGKPSRCPGLPTSQDVMQALIELGYVESRTETI